MKNIYSKQEMLYITICNENDALPLVDKAYQFMFILSWDFCGIYTRSAKFICMYIIIYLSFSISSV